MAAGGDSDCDSDTTSVASSAAEETADASDAAAEEDYAVEQARRRREHSLLQRACPTEAAAAAVPLPPPARRADPYDMLPKRYRDSRPTSANTTVASLSDCHIGFGADVPLEGSGARPASSSASSVAAASCPSARVPPAAAAAKSPSSRPAAAKVAAPAPAEDAAAPPSCLPCVPSLEAEAEAEAAQATACVRASGGGCEDDLLLARVSPGVFANMLEREDSGQHAGEQTAEGGVWGGAPSADAKFDLVQSVLEEIVESDAKFARLQRRFRNKHCGQFEDCEENKLVYTDIHRAWVATAESYIEKKLKKNIGGFDMAEFVEILQERTDEVSGEVWGLLASFTDFCAFKEVMLAHKQGVPTGAEPTGLELSRADLSRIVDQTQSIMDAAFARAASERAAQVADDAMHGAYTKLAMNVPFR